MSRNKGMPPLQVWYEPENYHGINWEPERDRHPHNLMPEPYKEIDKDEFIYHFMCGDTGLLGINFRQVYLPDEPHWVSAHFYLFHNKCLAATTRFEYDTSHNPGKGAVVGRHKVGRGYSQYKVRFFRIGCEHKGLKEVSKDFAVEKLGYSSKMWFHCDHVYYCEECGYHRKVNSGD